ELVADAVVNADRLESHCSMKRNAGFIGQRDAGYCIVETLQHQQIEKLLVEQPRNPSTTRFFAQVRGYLDRPLIRGALPMPAGVGIAKHAVVRFKNQPRRAL